MKINDAMRRHNVDEVRAHESTVTDGLILFFVRDDEAFELSLYGLSREQKQAIAAACVPCDCGGYTDAETAPLRPFMAQRKTTLAALNGDDSGKAS